MTEENRTPECLALMARLERPITNEAGKPVGLGELDYEIYVRTQELLALQTHPAQLVHHDEMAFLVVHQTQELWLKLAAHDSIALVRALDDDDASAFLATCVRVGRTLERLASDIQILETLTPACFQVIRRSLGNGSGLESPGYNRLREGAGAVREALARFLAARELQLIDVYRDDARAPDVLRVLEALVDVDSAFQRWLTAHFVVVRRTIGVDRSVRALDGFPTQALAVRMTRPLFPELWEARVEMTRDWRRAGGYAPGARRSAPPEPTGSSGVRASVDAPARPSARGGKVRP